MGCDTTSPSHPSVLPLRRALPFSLSPAQVRLMAGSVVSGAALRRDGSGCQPGIPGEVSRSMRDESRLPGRI